MSKSEQSSFKTPFIEKHQINEAAQKCRLRFWSGRNEPIDIESILEIELGINIIPVKNLLNNNGIDAFISKDFKSITIDSDIYYFDTNENRRRFSLAHELGHFELHQDLYQRLEFENTEDWIELIRSIPEKEYRFIEYHANEFAGRLLVPKHLLDIAIEQAAQLVKMEKLNEMSETDKVLDYVISSISKEFKVSTVVIDRRIQSENIDAREKLGLK